MNYMHFYSSYFGQCSELPILVYKVVTVEQRFAEQLLAYSTRQFGSTAEREMNKVHSMHFGS